MNQSTIFYEENYPDFYDGWSSDHFHYGFWHGDTQLHEESLINHSKMVAECLNIQRGDLILDAGCGTGGTCRYIIENYDASVVGILLAPTLLEKANLLSNKSIAGNRVSYHIKDYTATGYSNESFERVIAIESQCHAHDKELFINEAYRILKPGGRLVVSDFFLYRHPVNDIEKKSFREWCDGWAMPILVMKDVYKNLLSKKFSIVKCIDNTQYVLKSSMLMKDQARERLAISFIQHHQDKLPATRLAHIIATYRQGDCIEMGLWGHIMFIADKD